MVSLNSKPRTVSPDTRSTRNSYSRYSQALTLCLQEVEVTYNFCIFFSFFFLCLPRFLCYFYHCLSSLHVFSSSFLSFISKWTADKFCVLHKLKSLSLSVAEQALPHPPCHQPPRTRLPLDKFFGVLRKEKSCVSVPERPRRFHPPREGAG